MLRMLIAVFSTLVVLDSLGKIALPTWALVTMVAALVVFLLSKLWKLVMFGLFMAYTGKEITGMDDHSPED